MANLGKCSTPHVCLKRMCIPHLLGVVFYICQAKSVQIFYIFTNFYSQLSQLLRESYESIPLRLWMCLLLHLVL